MFVGNYNFARINLKKLTKALTKNRSLGFKTKPVAKSRIPGTTTRPQGSLPKASSAKVAQQNAARAQFENLGRVRKPAAKALNSGKSSALALKSGKKPTLLLPAGRGPSTPSGGQVGSRFRKRRNR